VGCGYLPSAQYISSIGIFGKKTSTKKQTALILKRHTGSNAASKRNFVGVFQLTTDGYAPCYGAYFYVAFFKAFADIKSGGIAFHCCAKCQYYFGYFVGLEALEQAIYIELACADAVHWCYKPAQHVVHASKLRCVFKGDDITHICHYTYYGVVTQLAAAYCAGLGIA
jgi:hypothetical protein